MRYFDVNIEVKEEDKEWAMEIGDNITTPAWSLRPYLLTAEDMERIKYMTDQFPVKPEYAAILMTPANTICKTHIDSIAREAWDDGKVPQQWKDSVRKDNIGQRISAINIPIRVHPTSMMQWMPLNECNQSESDEILEETDLRSSKCWIVCEPHRINNLHSPYNRVILSLSYTQKLDQLHAIYNTPIQYP